jgi:riboflavin kinase/FMN adenylyltransferase
METIKGIDQLSHSLRHPVVTIGNFDGLHLGHQKIVQSALEQAKKRGGHCIAYTFRPHPQVALRPGANIQLLSTYEEKLELLEALGVDFTIEEPFSREFSETESSEFFSDVLLHRLSVEAIVVGYDFAFGRGRHGHLENLEKFCLSAGVQLHVVPPQRIGGEVVSSSKIREYLHSGKIGDANRLLGRPFSYRGVVVKGEGRGRKLGFPTANLLFENKLTLPFGVYATRVRMNGQTHLSVTNVGVRPTFHAELQKLPVLVETHFLDLDADLYGSIIEVQFFERLREERKFSGVEELKAQILLDVQHARAIFHKSDHKAAI